MKPRSSCDVCGKKFLKGEKRIPFGVDGIMRHIRCQDRVSAEIDREIRNQMLEQQGADPNDPDTWEGNEY